MKVDVSSIDIANIIDFLLLNIANASKIQKIDLRFKLREDLIYYTNFNNKRERLYILNLLKKKIFKLIYDRQHYKDYYRTYDRISNSIYLRHLFKHLRIYVEYYSKCELNQTRRHKSYDSIILIDRPDISFHIIAINFIVALSITAEESNNLLIVINKFLKRVLLISKKIIFDATK